MNRLLLTSLFCALAFGAIRHNDASVSWSNEPVPATFDEGDAGVQPVEPSMHEFMEYVFQPAYLRLKESLKSAPASNTAWRPVKSDALILAESCNLLLSRRPEEHGDDWVRHAVASRTRGAEFYAAAKARNFDQAVSTFGTMLESCNACHRQFEEGKHILKP